MGKSKITVLLILLSLLCSIAFAYSEEIEVTDELLIELYNGARVADVVDAMVTVGYMEVGVMDPNKP